MSWGSLGWTVGLFWLGIHGLHRLCGRAPADTHVSLHFLRVRVETRRWNSVHGLLLSRLQRSPWRPWLEAMYSLGLVVGVLTMAAALPLLLWTTWTLLKPWLAMPKMARLVRREMTLTPMVPGVTVPLSHVPLIVVCLFCSQILHELGHAVAAALHGLAIQAAGVSLVVCFPTAFVAFLPHTLPPLTHARVSAAGPFHNLLSWLLVASLFWSLDWAAYRHTNSLGRVITHVQPASPLAGHLVPGTLVTQLNDQSMAFSTHLPDPWTSFLLTESTTYAPELGWCTETAHFNASSSQCCLSHHPTPPLACFLANTQQSACLDPVPILTQQHTRCAADTCKDGFICVRPAETDHLLRITVFDPQQKRQYVVLWQGPRHEIYHHVTVGTRLPKFSFLPLRFPVWLNTLWEYMLMVNLSLFLFNLVPIVGLDGSHLLRSILAAAYPQPQSNDIEALESRRTMQHSCLEKMISALAGFLIALDFILALIRISFVYDT
ncbi:hypothetical protein Ac2012v2_007197 [Leucoagaricus gongylophorus]